jgi:hypothetical protein
MADDLAFWRRCCEHGISICRIPKPFKEDLQCWIVEKTPTFRDRSKWHAAHTFDREEEMFAAVERYFATGTEPPGRYG